MKKTMKIMRILLLAGLLLPALSASGQQKVRTVRNDVNLDGVFGMDDLTELINYLLTDSWNDYPRDLVRDTVTVNGVDFVMVKVDGGSYAIEEGVTATVGDFWIGQTEVTQDLWDKVMGSNPSYSGPQHPVYYVSWDDCQSFISKLNEMTGKTFRLPSSIEWEFAARGGNHTHGYVYAGSNNPTLVAYYSEPNYDVYYHNVGRLHPNELDLYDMSGNVCEWCQTIWNGDSDYHIVRGGSCRQTVNECRVSWIGHYNVKNIYCGLRLAM